MASAQAMEEELQQSVLLSEDAEYETADTAGDDAEISRASESKTNSSGGITGEELGEDEEDLSDRDASGEEIDVDAEGEEEGDLINNQIVVGHFQHVQTEDGDGDGDGDEDEDEDEDEEDDEVSPEPVGHDVDDEEAVGAVKIKPGASADSDDEDMDSEVSDLPSAPEESDEEPAWEAEEADEEDESETGPTHKCMFCQQDEEDDPSEDFEAFLACNGCEKNAHQQCARDAAAMSEHNVAQSWACPDCNASDSELDIGEPDGEGASLDGDAQPESQLLEDSLATEQDKIHVDTKPSFDKPVLDNESASGAQSPGKRKSSSVEPDEVTSSLRKRRRNIPDDIISANEEGLHTRQSAEPARTTSRALRLKVSRPPPVVVEKRSRNSLVLKIQVRPGNLKEILSRRRRDRRRPATSNIPPPTPMATPSARPNNNDVITPVPVPVPVPTPAPAPASILATPFTTDVYSQPFYSFFDKETEDMKGKPYGGILTEAEADTSKTLPQPEDRRRFDEAKQRAEDEWRARVLAMQAEADVPIRKSRKPNDNASQIECIEFGGWEIDTWYAAPYPAEYSRNRVLYICEFCLKYMNSDYVAWRHKLKCATKHPPGDEIYRHGSVSMFEVDGRKNPVYCQNLCLLAKLFLGSKTLYYDVEPFLFYVLCEYDDCGYHFVGYFSKEKRASSQNNVSCILTLPIHQRKGYGNLLIDFSYLLTKVEEKTGSPEKPLSDMGLVSYRNYWRLRLCQYFLDVIGNDDHKKDGLSIKQISDDTGMTPDDVIAALEGLRALVRDPQTKLYAFRIDVEYCRQYVAKWEAKGYVQLRAKSLAWTPYLMGRSNAVNFELGPPITAIAPREDDETKVLEVQVEAVPGQMTITEEIKAAISFQTEASVASETRNASGDSASEPVMSIEKVAPEDRENAEPQDIMMLDVEPESPIWAKPYRNIPPSRFEIFPPVGGSRRSDRSRQSGARSAVSRAGSGSSRPRPKRSGGSSRRPTASRPRNNTSRRKTGGTGRGPGRWPKGTKKADYGNAASGPGMPPGWDGKTMCDAELLGDAGQGSEVAPGVEEQIQDEVQVCVARPATNGYQEDDHSGAELEVSDAESDEEIDDHNDVTSQADDDVDAEGEDE